MADDSVIELTAVDVGSSVGRQIQIFSDPQRMAKIEAHIMCGGSLTDLVSLQAKSVGLDSKQLYVQTRMWINADAGRKAAYAEALKARDEWMFERVLYMFSAVSELDLATLMNDDGTYKPMSEWPKAASLCVKSMDVLEQTDADGNKTGEIKRVVTWDKNKTLDSISRHLSAARELSAAGGEETWASQVAESFGPEAQGE